MRDPQTPAPHAWLDKATSDTCKNAANLIGRQQHRAILSSQRKTMVQLQTHSTPSTIKHITGKVQELSGCFLQRTQEPSYLACSHGHLQDQPRSPTPRTQKKQEKEANIKKNTKSHPNSSISAAPAKNTESMPQEERRVAESRARP